MTTPSPHFDDLVDPADPDRARLLAAHELLIAAGPRPELSPELEEPPADPGGQAVPFTRRRYTLVGAVAIAATILFGVGYTVGARNGPGAPVETIAMTGADGAEATIDLLAKDDAGNWPLNLNVSGLPELPPGSTYTLWLTKDGELAEPCGSFVVAGGTTEVPLNAPYRLRAFDGWVVVRTGTTEPLLTEKGA